MIEDTYGVLAEALLPGSWPTADPVQLRSCAERADALREQLNILAYTVRRLHRDMLGEGEFHESADRCGHAQLGRLSVAVAQLGQLAAGWTALAEVAEDARGHIAAVASVADRDRLVGEVAALLGDDARTGWAASSGQAVLRAAHADYVEAATRAASSAQLVDTQDIRAATPPPESSGMPGGETSGAAPSAMPPGAMMMPGMMAGLGAAGVGATVAAARAAAESSQQWSAADDAWLRTRAVDLHAGLPAPVGDWVRTAVAVAFGPDGRRHVVVATSDPHPYWREGLVLAPEESLIADGRDPEVTLADRLTERGMVPVAIAVGGPVGGDLTAEIVDDGVGATEPDTVPATEQ